MRRPAASRPGNLIVIAARPSMGKSALVANIAENAALAGFPVALFSLEMSEAELAQRFVASQARVKGEDLRRGHISEKTWPKILEGSASRLGQAPLYVDDSSDTSVLDGPRQVTSDPPATAGAEAGLV